MIDPRELEDEPALTKTLEAAGFELTVRPGTWTMKSTSVQIDLLVPSALGGSGRRGARLGKHGNEVARKTQGLEACVVDHSPFAITALDPSDHRSFEILVAGPAALLVAKLHKIAERKDDYDRIQDKDGLDVLRILQASDSAYLALKLKQLCTHQIAAEVTRAARTFLVDLFSDRKSVGAQMAVRSSRGLVDGETIALSCEVLASKLLEGWE